MDFTLPLYFLFEEKFPSRFHWKLSPKFPAMSLTQPIFMEYLSLIAQLVKNPPAMQDYPSSIPGSGGYPGEGKGYPLQYSGLENFTDCIVHGVATIRTRLRDFHFHFSCMSDISLGFEI